MPPSHRPDTSAAAAASMRDAAPPLRQRVLAYLRRQGELGATAEEIADALRLSGNTVRPRLVELRSLGLVIYSEGRRPTRSSRQAVVVLAAAVD